ncbi:MAG: relaxase/mobilization nuclease domain-containing protein [Bacillus sp. (in: Bacteria)]|nr:relaxase/mobilization nuclease domain-containing protein [Bacillus sp. (in: firmicutes)]MCM1424978.1 relaxase/mobilization nuclease domain-containing protein [Eubacterium sp.]
MATSKIKAIKNTLKKAIDYIINPDKTDAGQLVYSYSCSINTADIEMGLTAEQGNQMGNRAGNRVAYHLIQSFSPEDDITPEQALKLGIEFAQKVTRGKHEFVIATHIDKGHIHNHIIFNSVDYVSHKKYHSNKKDKYRIRDINDEICKENNLSVLPKYDAKRKRQYNDNHKEAGWKNKLKEAIDSAIQTSDSFDDFLFAMEMEGYTIKKGKYIAFHAPEQMREGRDAYTRAKTVGDDYTEDAIKQRIANKEKSALGAASHVNENDKIQENKQSTYQAQEAKTKKFDSKRINLLVDIDKNIKAQESKAYEQALVKSNINTLVKTMNFLMQHGITTSYDFQNYADGKKAEYSLLKKDIENIENELLDLSEKIKFTKNYKQNAAVFYESKRVKNPAEYIREHEKQIVLFKSAEIYFQRKQISPKEINLSELFEKYKELSHEKSELLKKSSSLKSEINELTRVSQNIKNALDINLSDDTKQQDKEKSQNERNI